MVRNRPLSVLPTGVTIHTTNGNNYANQVNNSIYVDTADPRVVPEVCTTTTTYKDQSVNCTSPQCMNTVWFSPANHLGCWNTGFFGCYVKWPHTTVSCKPNQAIKNMKDDIQFNADQVIFPSTVTGYVRRKSIFDAFDINTWDEGLKKAFGTFPNNETKLTSEQAAEPIPIQTMNTTSVFNTKGIHGIQFNTFWNNQCQLGDNVLTIPTCRTVDDNEVNPPIPNPNRIKRKYKGENGPTTVVKNWALENICNKVPGDRIDPSYITDHYYIKDKFGSANDGGRIGCDEYCKTPQNCQKGKSVYCADPNEWTKSVTDTLDICEPYWKTVWNSANSSEISKQPNKSIRSKLVDFTDKVNNVFSKTGYGSVCNTDGNPNPDIRNYDINFNWCNEVRGEYCSNRDAMFTKDCLNFCKFQPEMCVDNLTALCQNDYEKAGNEFIKGDLSSETAFKAIEKKMGEVIPGTNNTYGNWCGCMQSDNYYNMWRDIENKQWNKYGVNLDNILQNIGPECSYPVCKSGAIQTPHQSSNVIDGKCGGDCINAIFLGLEENARTGDITLDQQNECTKEDRLLLEGEISKFGNIDENINHTRNPSSLPNNTTPTGTTQLSTEAIIGIVVGCVVVLGISLVAFYKERPRKLSTSVRRGVNT